MSTSFLFKSIRHRSFRLAATASGAAAFLAASLAPQSALAEPAACLSPDPSQWPAAAKPYFMIAVDTSASMANPVAASNSCGYPNDRLGHARCALKKTWLTYAGQAYFGLSALAQTQSSCSGACFGGCAYTDFPGNVGGAGCGPEPACGAGSSGCRAGANILVPMQIDNVDSPPPSPSNALELLKWVDNNCTDQRELFASGNAPLNGVLRDMHRYLSDQWTSPTGSVTFTSPLASLAQGELACRSVNVILITAGDEGCDAPSDPVDAAASLFAGFSKDGITWKVKTHVVSLGGATSGHNQIAVAGGTQAAISAADAAQLTGALGTIIKGAIKAETCDNADNNCNGCTDEGYLHYCNQGQICCAWNTPAQRAACIAAYQSSVVPANPSGDRSKLPCTTAAQGSDPLAWLCYDPSETCDAVDNNCQAGVDENTFKCGSPAHCPTTEVCNTIDDDCDGLVNEGNACICDSFPSTEICDGCDNDCDGMADEDVPSLPCGQASPANCAGTLVCKPAQAVTPGGCVPSGGYLQCSSSPQPEVCDGIDNDCDGSVDDSIQPVECVIAGTPPNLAYGGASQCKKGSQTCGSGTCQGFVGPSPEICDGIDNDCDGQVDEGVLGVGQACGVNQPPCTPGTTACVNGAMVCSGGIFMQPEVCDGVDNNCNGLVDETPLADGPLPGQNGCWTSPGSCCTFGNNLAWCPPPGATCNDTGSLTSPCNAGKLACQGALGWACVNAKAPTVEACDGKDNNCDGLIDDGSLPGAGEPCGSDVGECQSGVLDCVGGVMDCVNDVPPSWEYCDGQDNDCDGMIDDAIPSSGPCSTAYDPFLYPGPRDAPPCSVGQFLCTGFGFECVGGVAPAPEVCDGIDNDCDGVVDESGAQPDGVDGTTSPFPAPPVVFGDVCGIDTGACQAGQYACQNAAVSCAGATDPIEEACDCEDNDCDGAVDEQDPGKPTVCSVGTQCAELGGTCRCVAPCGGGKYPCPPGQVCAAVMSSETGQPIGDHCVPEPCFICEGEVAQ